MTQLGFDNLLYEGTVSNEMHQLKAKYPGLPSTWDDAIPYHHKLIDRCHTAFLAADVDEINRVYDEAEALADLLQHIAKGYTSGILAPDGSGTRLATATRALPGIVPHWGQEGDFIIEAAGMRVRMDTDGIFGIATRFVILPGFGAHAVDYDKPFLSETGFRSFIGYRADLEAGMTVDVFAKSLIEYHVKNALKGKLLAIEQKYRERAAQELSNPPSSDSG